MAVESLGVSSLFKNRFLATILMSGLFVQIGIWVRNFGVLLYVMDRTHGNAYAVSLISVAEFAPIFIFSFIGGTFADRWPPKRTMVICDLFSGLALSVILGFLSSGAWQAVFFATLASSILSQFSQPAGMRLFKLYVPEEYMQAGMSIYQTMFAIFMIIGPMIGTFVYQHFGIFVCIIVTGIAFLFSAGTLLFLPRDHAETQAVERMSLLFDMREGIRYVLSKRVLSALGGCFLSAGLAIGLIQPLGIFIVTERLHLPQTDLQWFTGINGLAMVIGGVVSMVLAKRIAPHIVLFIGMAVSGLTIAGIGVSTIVWLSLLAQFLGGLVMPGIQISINTMILSHTENAYVGRVNGILNPLFMGGMILTMMVAGALVSWLSIVWVYLFSGMLFCIGLIALVPIFRKHSSALATELGDQA
ncbi:MFS transporter [Ferroacidibacillus organovorans]|uniref:MFS transporter n=1 Tax=Ferroacidibacillus organovorans TaxID=1765683 RepID=A0A101XR85_9BACL|nr:MFS transporter [Ferroacidibacillus organovorans]KUO96057.1 MFS transporter [Ferroacidibacillus organovorans]